jgi:hypothetical protein
VRRNKPDFTAEFGEVKDFLCGASNNAAANPLANLASSGSDACHARQAPSGQRLAKRNGITISRRKSVQMCVNPNRSMQIEADETK